MEQARSKKSDMALHSQVEEPIARLAGDLVAGGYH
jgi:hypothetical protein